MAIKLGNRTASRRACIYTFLAVLAILAAPAHPVSAEGPTVEGAGSTWSKIAIDQWRADVARRGLSINYQGNGSTAGRNFYLIDQTDFAVSEIPFEAQEQNQLRDKGKSFQYLPIVAGGTSFMYNLVDDAGKRITDLRLSGATIGGIFTGTIRNWNDPKITEDNAGRVLPSRDIIPVIRSDGSGTSAQFSTFVWKMFPDIWADFARRTGIRNEPTSFWPEFPGSVGQQGSDGVANYVANDQVGKGSINYVEAGYAKARGRPVTQVRNQAGNFALPSAGNVAVALTHAKFNADSTQNLDGVYRAPEASAYPISSYSYMITPTAEKDLSAAKGNVLGKFILYFACEGQKDADRMGYSPLPPNLVQGAFDAVKRIPGAPAPPPMSECDNPTIKQGIPPPSGFTPATKPAAPIVNKSAPKGAANTPAEAAAASKAAAASEAAKAAQQQAATAGTKAGSGGTGTDGELLAVDEYGEEAEEFLTAEEQALALSVDPGSIDALVASMKKLRGPSLLAFVIAAGLVALLVAMPFLWALAPWISRRLRHSVESIRET